MPGRSKIIAIKSRDGAWILTLDRESEPLPGHKAHAQVALSKDQGDGLERLLANPCLYAEPELVANEYPTLNGKPGACFDGANTFVDISFDGRRRTAVQACETYGLTGKLIDLVREPLKNI